MARWGRSRIRRETWAGDGVGSPGHTVRMEVEDILAALESIAGAG